MLPLVINSLRGRHTYKHTHVNTHTCMQTDIMDKSNFKKPGVHWSAAGAPGLLIYDTWQCKATLYIFLCLVLAKKLQLF